MKRQKWWMVVCVVVTILCLAGLMGIEGSAGAETRAPVAKGMVDVGTLNSKDSKDWWTDQSHCRGINDQDQVVGFVLYGIPGAYGWAGHAFSWDPVSTVMYDLGLPPDQPKGSGPGNTTLAFGVNNSGEIVVNFNFGDPSGLGNGWGYIYSGGTGGTWKKLGTFNNNNTVVNAINSLGEAVGRAWSPDPLKPGSWGWFACYWDSQGKIYNLGHLQLGTHSEALAINNDHVVVGDSGTQNGTTHAVVWTNPTDALPGLTDIGKQLDAADPGSYNTESHATGINTLYNSIRQPIDYRVVGYYYPTSDEHGFIFEDGVTTDLGILFPFGSYSRPMAINDNGDITGYGNTSFNFYRAFFDSISGSLLDLGCLYISGDYNWSRGYAINNLGHVVGESQTQNQNGNPTHGFFIKPIWPCAGQAAINTLLSIEEPKPPPPH
jgi:probable HAF family extracellular repeat protein